MVVIALAANVCSLHYSRGVEPSPGWHILRLCKCRNQRSADTDVSRSAFLLLALLANLAARFVCACRWRVRQYEHRRDSCVSPAGIPFLCFEVCWRTTNAFRRWSI